MVGGDDASVEHYRSESGRLGIAADVHFAGPRPLAELGDLVGLVLTLVCVLAALVATGGVVGLLPRYTARPVLNPDIVLRPLEDAAAHQFAKPVGQYVAGDSEARLEMLEMLQAVEGPAEDEEGPFLADQLDRVRQRTMQGGVPERPDIPS